MKKKEKLKRETISRMEKLLVAGDYEAMITLLLEQELHYKTLNQIKNTLYRNIPPYICRTLGKDLVERGKADEIILAGVFLELGMIWKEERETTRKIIRKHSVTEDWKIREVMVNLMKHAIAKDMENYKPLFVELVRSDNVYLKRVAIMAAEKLAASQSKIIDLEFLHLLDPFIDEKESFITSVATTAFSTFLTNYPDITVTWVKKHFSEPISDYGKASLLYMFSTHEAKDNVNDALLFLDREIKNNNDRVKHARSAILRNFSAYYPNKVNSWLESKMHIPEAMDHWAELELTDDTLLNL